LSIVTFKNGSLSMPKRIGDMGFSRDVISPTGREQYRDNQVAHRKKRTPLASSARRLDDKAIRAIHSILDSYQHTNALASPVLPTDRDDGAHTEDSDHTLVASMYRHLAHRPSTGGAARR
jgi:hypothetical protein